MNPLVTPSWLASRITDSGVSVLDATLPPVGVTPRIDTRARYREEHIPGAIFFDIEALSDTATSLPHMLPSAETFSSAMSALGVGTNDTIVVYEQEGVFSAPRAWWMFRTLGAEQVFVLDGGLQAWVEAGLPVEQGESSRPPADFRARLHPDAVVDFEGIRQRIAGSGQILDARSAGRFSGAAPEPRPGLRSGHMPGAISVPYTDLVASGRLKAAEALAELFAARNIELSEEVITTCGSGVTAAVIALGLEIAGAGKVALYDGSWAEYAQHPEAVIETSPVQRPPGK